MKRDLNYYQKLKYKVIIERNEDEGYVWYHAYTKELGKFSCYGSGETADEAVQKFYEIKDEFLDHLFSEDLKVPEPEDEGAIEKYSGTFNVRTSKVIHFLLSRQAYENEVSMNAYLNQILATAVGVEEHEQKTNIKIRDLTKKMDKVQQTLDKSIRYGTIDFGNCRPVAETLLAYSSQNYLS
jgi:predicted HicB family RNase H-like nuclease